MKGLRLLLLLAAFAATAPFSRALAQEEPKPGEIRAAVEAAVKEGRPDKAGEILRGLLETDVDTGGRRVVEGARAAMDLLPREGGNTIAAALLAKAIQEGSSGRASAWTAAQDLRRRLLAELDVENGRFLLGQLIDVYPQELSYRYDLGRLLMDAGQTRDARAAYLGIATQAPSEVDARYTAAWLADLLGDVDAALAEYEALIRERDDLWAHVVKARLLLSRRRDHAAARAAIDAGYKAAHAQAPGEHRDKYLALLDEEKIAVERAVDRRERLREIDGRLDGHLTVIGVGWLVVLVGGLVVLRRRGDI